MQRFDWVFVCTEKKNEMPIRQEEFPYDVGPTDQLTAELKLKLLKLGLVVHGFPAKTKRRYYIQVAAVRLARCARVARFAEAANM